MSRLQSILRSRITWAIIGMALAGYFAFLVAVLGLVASAPRNIVVLNVNSDGDLELADGTALVADEEIDGHLAALFEKARRATHGGKPEQVKTLVIITAPRGLEFSHVWRIMHASKRAGFTRLDLRRIGEDISVDTGSVPDAEEVTGQPAILSPAELALPFDLVLQLRSLRGGQNGGALAAIIVRSPDGETAVADLDALRRFLRLRRVDGIVSPEIRIQADANLMYGVLLTATKECQKAGFTRVRYLPPSGWEWQGN